jgi:hypothetical protein
MCSPGRKPRVKALVVCVAGHEPAPAAALVERDSPQSPFYGGE